MSTLFGGSMCLNDIVEKAKAGHSAFSKAGNGKVYFNVNIWVNDQKDKFGNEVSIQLSSKKENRESEGKVYIGNAKMVESQNNAAPVASADVEISFDDLPF